MIVTKPTTFSLRTKLRTVSKEQKYFGVTVPHSSFTIETFLFYFLLSHLSLCSFIVYPHNNFTVKTSLVCFRYIKVDITPVNCHKYCRHLLYINYIICPKYCTVSLLTYRYHVRYLVQAEWKT